MRTTIDKAGRLVVPKALREALGLRAGDPLDIEERDGRLEIDAVPTPMRLVERGGHWVAVTQEDLPPLSRDLVRKTLEQVRR